MADNKQQPKIEVKEGSQSSSPYSRPATATVTTKSGKSYNVSIE